ncbi:hypothetical protein HDZ31DRAFT_42548 [Schizophyllum fasciatum]
MLALTAAAATLGLASTAAAGPFRRSSALSIDVSAPESITSLDDMSVVATVTNTGSEPVKVLKAGSVLDDKLPTRSFFVKKGDIKVDFSGVKVSMALDKLSEASYVTIQPGSSVNATHDSEYLCRPVSSLYNFESAGAGDFDIEPVTWFQVPDVASSKVKSISDFSKDDASRTLNCSDELNACEDGVIAYTVTATTNVYFCDIFFDEVQTDRLCAGTTVAERNIRGGTVLHELTHALKGTEDVGYGCKANTKLSDEEKISNADNFNCFSTQVYADTKC